MSEFRLWLIHMWNEHCRELEGYNQPLPYNSAGYFHKYKYWLKREFKHMKKGQQ